MTFPFLKLYLVFLLPHSFFRCLRLLEKIFGEIFGMVILLFSCQVDSLLSVGEIEIFLLGWWKEYVGKFDSAEGLSGHYGEMREMESTE